MGLTLEQAQDTNIQIMHDLTQALGFSGAYTDSLRQSIGKTNVKRYNVCMSVTTPTGERIHFTQATPMFKRPKHWGLGHTCTLDGGITMLLTHSNGQSQLLAIKDGQIISNQYV